MGIYDRLILKSKILLAAMHALTAPALCIGALFAHMAARCTVDADAFKVKTAIFAAKKSFPKVSAESPVYNIAAKIAEDNGVDLFAVYMDERYPFQGILVGSEGPHAAIFMRGNPLLHGDIGERGLKNLVAHEITHVLRRVNDETIGLHLGRAALAFMSAFYGVGAAASGSTIALLLASTSVLAVTLGIPALERAYTRNEEYLADIGAGALNDDPQGLHDNMNVFANMPKDPSMIQAPEDKNTFRDDFCNAVFGRTHPSYPKRQAMLRDIFDLPPPVKTGSPATRPQTSPENLVP